MKKGLSRFLTTFTLLSRIPLKASFEADYSRSDFWIPAISPLVSIAAAAGGGLGFLVFRDPLLAAIAAVASQYWCFNLFHVDGLLDSADAMAPFATRERRFEILKDPRIGSYAFFYGWLALAAKVSGLALVFRTGIGASVLVLLAAPLAGRAACASLPLLAAPARREGLGSLMSGFSLARFLLGCLTGLVPLGLWAALTGSLVLGAAASGAALAGGVAGGLGMAALYKARLGGFTGDALGAAVEVGELVAVLVLAASLRFLS